MKINDKSELTLFTRPTSLNKIFVKEDNITSYDGWQLFQENSESQPVVRGVSLVVQTRILCHLFGTKKAYLYLEFNINSILTKTSLNLKIK